MAIQARNIEYAVIIDTGTSINDISKLLYNGKIPLITGKYGYDNITRICSASPSDTIDSLIWIPNWIVKDQIGSCSRSVDLTKGADYGNIGSFNFSIKNDTKYWKTLQTIGIKLFNKDVKVYAVINSVFYQLWKGKITDIDREPNELVINCEDDSVNIHKLLPNTIENNIVKPVVLGDIPYIEASRIEESNKLVLNIINGVEIKSTYIYNMSPIFHPVSTNPIITNTLDLYKEWMITIISDNVYFNDNELQNKFISLKYIKHNPDDYEDQREKIDDFIIPITRNESSYENNGRVLTTFYTKSLPFTDPPFFPVNYPGDLTDGHQYYEYNSQMYNGGNVKPYQLTIEILNLSTDYIYGQSGLDVNVSNIYKYDKDLNVYTLVPIEANNNGDGTITVKAANNIEGGELLSYYNNIPITVNTVDVDFQYQNNTTGEYGYYDCSGYYNPSNNNIYLKFPSSYVFYGTHTINAFVKLYSINSSDVYDNNITIYSLLSGCQFSGTGGSATYNTLSGHINENEALIIDKRENIDNNIFNFKGTVIPHKSIVTPYLILDEFNSSALYDKNNDSYGIKSHALNIKGLDNITYVYHTYVTVDGELNDGDYYLISDFDVSGTLGGFINTSLDIHYRVDITPINMYGQEENDVLQSNKSINELYVKTANKFSKTLNIIPHLYFNDVNYNGSVCLMDNWYEEIGTTALDKGFGKEFYKLDDDLVKKIKDKEIKYLKISHYITYSDINYPIYCNYYTKLKEVALFCKKAVSLDDKLYIKQNSLNISGINYDTNNVYGMFRYILEQNDGISASNIDYNNLDTFRGSATNWYAGRQFYDQKNSKEYLRELCKQSFVALYPNRKGQRRFSCFLDNPTSASIDDSLILKDSLKQIAETPMRDIYNDFSINYNQDIGSKKLTKNIIVTNTDKSTFPAVYENWTDYVTGIDSYNLARSIWTYAHEGYEMSESITKPPTDLSDCYYYVDKNSDDNSPIEYLKLLVGWASRQHYTISFEIPLTESTINYELCDTIDFKHDLLSDGEHYKGFISNITIDINKNKIKLTLICDKDSNFNYTDLQENVLIYDAEFTSYYSYDRTSYDSIDANDVGRDDIIDSTKADRSFIEELG